jgi:polar amino acid transport system substrate-binding protein
MYQQSGIFRIALAASLALLPLSAHALIFLTEENPPFNFTAAGKVTGASTEIVTEMAKRAGVRADIRALAWDAAYLRAQADRDTCLYSTSRLENRERLFQWVGPIGVNKWALFGRENFSRPIKSVADLRLLKIGGVEADAKVEFLKANAVTNIKEVARDDQNPPRLFLKPDHPNYIDLWVAGYYSGLPTAQRAKAGPVKLVYMLREQELWVACSPRTDKAVVKQLVDALAAMEKEGVIKRVAESLEKGAGTR